MKHIWIIAALLFVITVPIAQGDPVKKATKWLLQGQRDYSQRKYTKSRKAFEKAYSLVPLHPHFYCVRAHILMKLGQAQVKTGLPYKAMASYYKASRLCAKKQVREEALKTHQRLYKRWMSFVELDSTPTDAWVIMNFKKDGKTPWKRVLRPGTYRFRIRMTDYQSSRFVLELKPGQRVQKNIKLKRGEDPLHRKEEPIVPPPPIYRP